MLKSMTGYGAARTNSDSHTINVEVKTLNSKFLDTNLRLPKNFSEHELTIRNLVSEVLERGKVSLSVDIQNEGETALKQKYNEVLFEKYYNALASLAEKVGAGKEDLFKTALAAPDVIVNIGDDSTDTDEFDTVKPLILKALQMCDEFRIKEGQVLADKLQHYILKISDCLEVIESLDPKRITRIRERIKGNLKKFIDEESIDTNRLEQEIIFYIEKLDITEEKVRLKNHLNHFSEVMANHDSTGKKLGFISQEIGREINTIGSKANDAEIQQQVVSMKEELERIKEQLLNVI